MKKAFGVLLLLSLLYAVSGAQDSRSPLDSQLLSRYNYQYPPFPRGELMLTEGGKSIWFYIALGFFFFTHLTSPYFVTPKDSLVNSLTSALLLATVNLTSINSLGNELNIFRWVSFWVSILVAICALISIILFSINLSERPGLSAISKLTYTISDHVGRGQIMFSPLVLISIIVSCCWLRLRAK